jgi:hypothetical protein
MAERFLREQLAAGRTAEQIAATHDYITGPWREAPQHTAAQRETYRGYTELVAQQLAQLRAATRHSRHGSVASRQRAARPWIVSRWTCHWYPKELGSCSAMACAMN